MLCIILQAPQPGSIKALVQEQSLAQQLQVCWRSKRG
jgi:hypothetical protein